MKARFRGGPRDGQELELEACPLELLVEAPGSPPVRYVLGLVDRHDVRWYHVPPQYTAKKPKGP